MTLAQTQITRRQLIVGGGATLAGMGLLAACVPAAPQASSPTPARGPTVAPVAAATTPTAKLAIAQPASPLTLDGGLSSNIVDRNLYLALYDTLFNWKWEGDKASIVPGLGTEYRSVDDSTWQVKLRKGVTFHNGDPFTAADVKFTIERALDPASKASQKAFYSVISRVDVVDDQTVNVVTNGPQATLPIRLTLFPMIPKKYVTDNGDAKFAERPVGSGPYLFEEYLKDDHLTLKANSKYWGSPPSFESVTYNFIPTDAARVAALRSGNVDVVVNLPPDSIKSLQGDSSLRTGQSPADRGMLMYIDTIHGGPLADKRVRQALNYAIDRDTLVKTVLSGAGVPISASIPAMFFGYDTTIKPYPYDVDKAKQLLADAGYKDGFKLIIRHPNGFYPKDKQVAEAISGQLDRVGIKVDDRGSESATYFPDLLGQYKAAQGDPIVFLGSWGAPVLDAGVPWAEQFGSASPIKLWPNEQFKNMVDEGLTTLDEAKRRSIYNQAHRLLYDEAPAVFLWQVVDSYGLRSRVKWQPRPDQLVSPTDMSLG